MEEQKKDQINHGAMCGAWCGCGHRHLILRWILGLVILVFVFSFGMRLGEIKAAFEYGGYGSMGYSHRSMMRRAYYPAPSYGNVPTDDVPQVQTAPAQGQ
jgi:hypothetical protein